MSDAVIGSDVHAIGHPRSELWTYTKGVVSQIHQGYSWNGHKANVIQTQTPINPGNSGGPLISNDGKLIGINSFQVPDYQNMNFAVSIDEIRQFLGSPTSSLPSVTAKSTPPQPKQCKPKELYKHTLKDGAVMVKGYDVDCDGEADAEMHSPKDPNKPIVMKFDRNNDGKADVAVVDRNRDGKWDISVWDDDFDGKIDRTGFHPDGNLTPSRYEPYQEN